MPRLIKWLRKKCLDQIENQASPFKQPKAIGKLPAYSENPREQVNAITTKSGKQLQNPPLVVEKRLEEVLKEKEPNEDKLVENQDLGVVDPKKNDIDVRNNPSHENRPSAFAAHKSLSPPTRRRGRMSEAGILKPASSQSLSTIEDFQTRERRAEEGNKPSDGEQLMPVSDSLKRAEEENKPSDGGFRSASTKKRSNSGETSKKLKRKCSPSEKAARKQAEKLVGSRIKVNYDDGDVEDLDLSIERWELIRDVKSAVDEQETVAGVADLSEIKLDHVTNSDRSARSTCKARDGAKLPVLKQEVEQRKVSRSNSAPSKSERAKDASVELPVVKQEVEKRKVIRIKPTHQRLKNKRRRTKKATPRFPVLDSEKVNVKGYQVKASAAPILEEIFEKHGDIAANYPYPSRGFRTSVFEVICDVIRQLRTNDLGIIVSMVGQMRTEVSDTAAAAHLEVSMLKQILDDILTEGDGQLASVIRNTSLVSKAARKDLTQRKAELVIAERSYEEAKRQLERAEQSKRTAERAVEVLESVKKKAQNDMELNFNKRNDLQNSLQTFEGFRVRENNGIVRVHCEDSGKELFAEKSQWCRSEPSH
nr:microtubule-associated protein futsch-like isoform X3 [Ipomoea batatas]